MANEVFLELDKRQTAIQKIENKEDVEDRIQLIKERFKETVGEFPQKKPLNPKVTGIVEKDFYILEKIIYESRPNFFVTAAIFRPKSPPKKQLPAILYLSGHSDVAFRSTTYQRVILNLVKKGFLVMAIDPIGQGERKEILEREMPFKYSSNVLQHSYIGSQCLLAGDSFIKHMIWDGIRAIDYLESREDVDIKNIGATGRSGGGTQTAWLGVFEDRLKATAIENYMTSFRRLIQSIGFQDAEQHVSYGISNGLDFPDLVLARAPKPTLIISTEADFFNIQGSIECYRELQGLYALLEAKEKVSWQTDIAGHASTPKNREALYQFFLKNLGTPQDSKDDEIDPIPAESLVVLDENHKKKMFDRTVFEINKESYLSAKKQFPNRPKTIDSTYLKEKLGIKWNNGKAIKTSEIQLEKYSIEKYFIEHQEYPLPFVVLKPKQNQQKKVLVYYSPKGKEVLAEEKLLSQLEKGYTLVLVDLLGIGELGQGNYGQGSSAASLNPNGIPPNIWFMSNQSKRSILGIWVADMKRIQEFVSSHFANYEKYIWATDYLSIPALHLSKFTDDYHAMGLHQHLYSWESIITNKFYDPKWLMASLPGISFQYDLPQLLRDSKSIQILNLVGPSSEAFDKRALQKLPDYQFYKKSVFKKTIIDEYEALVAFLK